MGCKEQDYNAHCKNKWVRQNDYVFGTDFNDVQPDLFVITFPSFFLSFFLQPCSPKWGLRGDRNIVWIFQCCYIVDLEKCRKVKTCVENPTVNNAGMCPWQD